MENAKPPTPPVRRELPTRVTVLLSGALLAKVDDLAETEGVTRAEAIRRIIAKA